VKLLQCARLALAGCDFRRLIVAGAGSAALRELRICSRRAEAGS